ncbi:hypothetical protein [Longitalea luteola]|uniref:hypothetical protein n=1 Tax=Longitalea luteola TaxID=2812563 RepID=UPI001A970FE2|nr:hypothetical protein [Longitalea luteola]
MKRVYLTAMTALISSLLWAQDKAADVDINVNKDSGGGGFWGSPVMWIIGAAVFIIVLVAVSRSGSRQ